MSVPRYVERGGFRFDHPRILHRSEMAPFGRHQLATEFGPYEVLDPVFASGAGASIVRMAPGHVVAEHAFSTEHLLVGLTGLITLRLGEDEHRLQAHDIAFIPAFMDFGLENADQADWSEYLSVNLRKDEWPGRRFRGDDVLAMEVRSTPEG
jgi:quercetin dioxygenase-like cupin family protein